MNAENKPDSQRKERMKKYLLIGGVVAALAVGIVAVAAAGAQEATPTEKAASEVDPEARMDHYLELLAGNLGVSVDELESALTQTQIDLINEKVADGTLSEEDAADIIEKIENGEGRLFPPFFGGGPGHHHHPGLRIVGNIFETAADILDMNVDTLHEQVRDGSSLGEIAEAQGMDVDTFKAELESALQAAIDAKVEDGTITEEMGQRLSDGLADHIDRIVDGTFGEGPHRPHFGPGGPFGGEGTEEGAETSLTF
jgi:uncharacterized protein YidB (DUF937 family)